MPKSACTWMFLILLPLVGVPATAADQTDPLLTKAAEKYAELDFEEALKLLERAKQVKHNTRAQLVRILHLSGLCQGSLQRYDEARLSFAHLLALDPTFRLGADVSPRVRAPFDELVKQNPRRLKVRSLPPPNAVKAEPLVLTFQVDSDQQKMARVIRVWFRRGGKGKYSSIHTPVKGEGEHRTSIPAPAWEVQGVAGPVSWFALVEGEHGAQLQNFGNSLHPYVLEVAERGGAVAGAGESAWYQKWWVWTIVGGVAIAATTTAVVLTSSQTPSGPFDFTVDFSTNQ